MFNKPGISKVNLTSPNQILANVELQESIGCVVPQSLAVQVGNNKVVKAGTPIKVDFGNVQTPVAEGDVTGVNGKTETTANAVLLHDVDATAGNANGTALIFGFVNINRLDSDVAAKVAAGTNVAGVSFLKL